MSVEKSVKHDAEDTSQGMTLRELADFVEEARGEGIADDTAVKILSTMRGRIKHIEVKA